MSLEENHGEELACKLLWSLVAFRKAKCNEAETSVIRTKLVRSTKGGKR